MSRSGQFDVFALPDAIQRQDVGVDSQGRSARQRKRHNKSRNGCLGCKQMRVKCDEGRPNCGRCSNRGIECHYEDHVTDNRVSTRQVSKVAEDLPGDPKRLSRIIPSLASAVPARSPGALYCLPHTTLPESPTLQLINLRLLYHFEHSTSKTLLFGEAIWRDRILPLSLQHEYLSHAILLIAASHLQHLQPNETSYANAAAYHLDRVLSDFRTILSRPLAGEDADVPIACAFIILHYAWATPLLLLESSNSTRPNFTSDRFFGLASGVKSVIQTAGKVGEYSIFKPVLDKDSVETFRVWADSTECSYDFWGNFLCRPNDEDLTGSSQSDTASALRQECWSISSTYDVVDHLMPVLQAADAVNNKQDISYMMHQVQAYSCVWPAKAPLEFQEDVIAKQADALVTMAAFYAVTWWLFSEELWWVRSRSKLMCEAILAESCEHSDPKCYSGALSICEYFGFNLNQQGDWEVGEPGYVSIRPALAQWNLV